MRILKSDPPSGLKDSLLNAMKGALDAQPSADSQIKLPRDFIDLDFIDKVDMALTMINQGKQESEVMPVLAAISEQVNDFLSKIISTRDLEAVKEELSAKPTLQAVL